MKKLKVWKTPERPRVGQFIVVHGQRCKIFKVYPMGTLDCEAPNGRCWRVTGLSFP